jgi:glycosyltransferase involved in cell wall biosynthesis
MVMSHDPTLDPRVDWEAASAAERFDVVALGVQPREAGRPGEEQVRGYRLRRLPERLGPGVTFAFLARWLQAIGWRDRAIVIALAAIGWPFLAAHLAAHALLTLNAGSRRAKQSLQRGWARYTALAHAYLFLQEINIRFAPATVVLWGELREGLRPAVVHCNDLDTLLVGVLAKRRYCCRLVYDAHEFWPYGQPRAGWYYPPFFRFYEQSLIRQCDSVITVNPMLARAMAEEYGLDRVESVPNAEPWRDAVAPRRGEVSDLAGGRVKFLFQGRFAGERGVEELIRAWRHVDGSKAALFLRGPRNYVRDACEELARGMGLLGRSVYLLEPVAEEELVGASMEADVGMIPYKPALLTYKYCCPNKLSQFLQAGLMILCNELPYVKQVVAEAGAGLSFDTRDEATLVEAIRRATDDAALRRRCGESGRAYARSVFNWRQFYPVLESAYLGQPAPAARQAGGTAP